MNDRAVLMAPRAHPVLHCQLASDNEAKYQVLRFDRRRQLGERLH